MVEREREVCPDEECPSMAVAGGGEGREVAVVEIAVTHARDVEDHLVNDGSRTAQSVFVLCVCVCVCVKHSLSTVLLQLTKHANNGLYFLLRNT